ncbi:M28 family peptidase [Acidobacteria bacterium AH-259-A15]|nr:M28 family peptidase [Acidobacteria bacterium AH-259-A15]
MVGFKEASAQAQRDLEERYDSHLKVYNLGRWMKEMTGRPHHAGSPKAKENAEFIAELFKEWGYETEIETFHVLFPTPKVRELVLLEPERFEAKLIEPAVDSDSVSQAIKEEGLPPFNAYSADGDVTAELVYVNQGLPRDYEELERRGIDVSGKIVLARYGGSWRGIKPKVAAEKGAIGCIIYNDPKADGFYVGEGYPEGAFKHPTAVQRGSIMDLPMRPGDPLTPNYGATKDAKRITVEEAETIMKIPCLPISYQDALPLMDALGGPVAPETWRGAMPVTYRMGPGPAKVHLKLEFNWDLVPAYNVIARMEGSTFPDEWIIRGNHHDAWVVGASDPISGMITVMEQARAIGELAKTGWRPKRTLVFAAWDAEEPALLGSTEWVEHHAEELDAKAVAYINTDGNSRGFLRIGGSHALERLASQTASAVVDPQTDVSVAERRRSAWLVNGTADQKKKAKAGGFSISALGSGSDYSAFLQHLGIASFNVGFGGEGRGGQYHTNFDTFDHYTKYKDPTFDYGIALIQVCGRLTLRLAQADVPPFQFTGTAKAISKYVDEVVEMTDKKRKDTEERNSLIDEGHYARVLDPTKDVGPPKKEDPVPHINFAPLLNARDALTKSADAYEKALKVVLAGEKTPSKDQQTELNKIVYQSERAFIREEGLPRRPWYRHLIYAPGVYTGYGVKTLPGVREAIEERSWNEAEEFVGITAAAISKFAKEVDRAARILNGE